MQSALQSALLQATVDGLTGLANRGAYDRALAMSESRAARDGSEVGIIALDIDGLKIINDQHGHAAGDGLLLLTADVLHRCTRQGDLAARLGGDEFAVLVHADAEGVRAAANRLRHELATDGVGASVGWAMREAGGLRAARAVADERMRARKLQLRVPDDRRSDQGATAPVTAALSARVVLAEATGVIMHRRQCSAQRANTELAALAQECGVSLREVAEILLRLTAHDPLMADELPLGRRLSGLLQRGDRDRFATVAPAVTVPALPAGVPEVARILSTLTVDPRSPGQAVGRQSTGVLHVAGRYVPADTGTGSGGDWLDAFVLPDGAVALAVGDVAGHDAGAALIMQQARTLLRGIAVDRAGAPSTVLRHLDAAMVALGVGSLATALLARIEMTSDGELLMTWSSAGHPPPVVIDRLGLATALMGADDLLLGTGLPVARTDLTVRLVAGSGLLLFSDGLIERRRDDPDEGVRRLCDAAGLDREADPMLLCDALIGAMLDDEVLDDVALMVVRVER